MNKCGVTTHIDRCGGRFHRVCRWRWVLAGLESTASPCRPRQKQTDRHMKCLQGPTPPAHGDTGYETSPLTSGKAPPKSKNQYIWIFPISHRLFQSTLQSNLSSPGPNTLPWGTPTLWGCWEEVGRLSAGHWWAEEPRTRAGLSAPSPWFSSAVWEQSWGL